MRNWSCNYYRRPPWNAKNSAEITPLSSHAGPKRQNARHGNAKSHPTLSQHSKISADVSTIVSAITFRKRQSERHYVRLSAEVSSNYPRLSENAKMSAVTSQRCLKTPKSVPWKRKNTKIRVEISAMILQLVSNAPPKRWHYHRNYAIITPGFPKKR